MTGIEPILIGAAVAGTGVSIFGNISAAEQQKKLAERDALLREAQAQELIERESINENALAEQGELTALHYGSGAAASGVEGSGIGGQLRIYQNTVQTISNQRRSAEFQARMIRAGADLEREQAGNAVSSAYIQGAGSLLTAGAQLGYTYAKPTKGTALASTSSGSSFYSGQYEGPKYR